MITSPRKTKRDFRTYLEGWAKKRGFDSHDAYLADLIQGLGFKTWDQYVKSQLAKRGFKSSLQHKTFLAKKIGLKTAGEYDAYLAERRSVKPKYIQFQKWLNSGISHRGSATISWLSRRTGIHKESIRGYLKGYNFPREDKLSRLEAALGSSFDDFVKRNDPLN